MPSVINKENVYKIAILGMSDVSVFFRGSSVEPGIAVDGVCY